ncbi:P1 family peptidase [Nitratireductor sp. L1-7-SE]|uniref:P1 family peptidase n=1 Tax=Nitratireductor rhodophyticola TaxID=2854036 RepID=A0ABS7RAP1_9HYPH|nr:P1 family peptidase [Nitratireductor rhodophyticola]MBY8918011.1 P1 family peptidase [Nitratireductor rhodophyticola]MBY8921180.1 P1 family peptidase [Nitratireductor rhodophyticola]
MTDRIFDRAGSWWDLPAGPANTIADVPGVTVGHRTHREKTARTGVTAIFPHDGDLFRNPVPAGLAVLNGFGKSTGLMQLAELGRIETPILLTNTFGVAACTAALIRRAIAQNPEIGRSRPTVNPLVLECNDGRVSDIQALAVTEAMANDAMAAAEMKFAQGTVGAGTGMRTFGFAGAIGSASRRVALPSGRTHTLGALVLSNFGRPGDLRLLGNRIETPDPGRADPQDRGSVIIVYGTDAPLDSRQLARIARRAGAALGRLGSYWGDQSGDVALAFSTTNRLSIDSEIETVERLAEAQLDPFFLAAVEAAEEAVLNGLWNAEPLTGYDGLRLPVLRDQLLPNRG